MLNKFKIVRNVCNNMFITTIKENYAFLLLLIALTVIISIQSCAPIYTPGNCCKIKDPVDNQVKACVAGSLTQAECEDLANSKGNLYSFAPQSSCLNLKRNPDCGVDENDNIIGCYLNEGTGVNKFYAQYNPDNPLPASFFCGYDTNSLYKCDQGNAVIHSVCPNNQVCLNGQCVYPPPEIVGVVDITKSVDRSEGIFDDPPVIFLYTFYSSGLYSVTRGLDLRYNYQNNLASDLSNEIKGRYIWLKSNKIMAISNIYNSIYIFDDDGSVYVTNYGPYHMYQDITEFIPNLGDLAASGYGQIPNPQRIVAAVGSKVFYSDGTYYDISTKANGIFTLPSGKGYNDIKEITKVENEYYTFYSDGTFSVSDSLTNLANLDSGDMYNILSQDCSGQSLNTGYCACNNDCISNNCAPVSYPTSYYTLFRYSSRTQGFCCPQGQIYVSSELGGGSCQVPSCQDRIKNGDEDGVDCGGGCPSGCLYCLTTDYGCYNGPSAYLYAVGDYESVPVASNAIMEFADFEGVPTNMIDTSDEYMEAIAWYVDKYMTWWPDPWSDVYRDTAPADAIISWTYTRGCGNIYCGDCSYHSVLRGSLLRTLGVGWPCVWSADSYDCAKYSGNLIGHQFNIVYYKGKYRIMDYGSLGNYFVNRWNCHIPKNLWNDFSGVSYPYPNTDITGLNTLVKNYRGTDCPSSSWDYNTLYTDVCP